MNNVNITLDVSNIVECYLKHFMVITKKLLTLEQVFSVILNVPLHVTDMETYVYEALENIIDYPLSTDDQEAIDFYVGELLALSDNSSAIVQELENRAYYSYLGFLTNTNPEKINNLNILFKYHDLFTVNDTVFLIITLSKGE